MPIGVNIIEIYSNDGSVLLNSDTIAVAGDISVVEAGLESYGSLYTYSGTNTFLGVATSPNATEPTYAIGETISMSLDGSTITFYIVEEAVATSGVTVEYNGSVVATIPNGYKATLPIADKEMKTDIVITVPESSDEVIPEYSEVEDFAVYVNGLEGEVEISYSVSEKVALPAGSPARLASVSDANFIANNIKKDVSIFGLTGAYEGEEPNLISKTITENGTYKASEEVQDELAGTWLLDVDFVKVNDDEKSPDYIVNGYYNGLNLANNFEEGLKFKKLTIAHWTISGESKVNFNIYSELQYISTALGFEEYVDVTQTYYSRYSNVGDIVVNNGGTNYISPDSENGLKMRTITITSKLSEVTNGDLLLAWLKVNATKQSAPAIDGYSEVVVNVEATDSPLPIEVSTEAEMTALLESGEVGGVYKYTGTTGTYENGALYVLENATITFTIDGTEYEAEEGMTWEQWCNSKYNTTSLAVSDSYVYGGGVYVVDVEISATLSDRVLASDSITPSFAYYATGSFEPT